MQLKTCSYQEKNVFEGFSVIKKVNLLFNY